MTKSYRGSPGEQVVIHTPDQSPACGYRFQVGHDYLVYAHAAPGGDLSTSSCDRTHEVTSRADDEDIQVDRTSSLKRRPVVLFSAVYGN